MKPNPPKSTLNPADERFIKAESVAGVTIVAAAQLGVKKAKSEDVKAFSKVLVTDHTAANTELKTLATQKGVEISSKIDSDAKDIQKLETYNGAEFDKKFLTYIIGGHKKCVTAFEESVKAAECAEVKTWSTKILRTLKAHLAKAESLFAKLPVA